MIRKALLLVGLGLLSLAAVVLVRAGRARSVQVPVEPALAVEIDALEVAEHLAAALRFRTISGDDPSEVRAEEFAGLHAYLEQTFPRVHSTLTRDVIGDHTLLYTWLGREPGLHPILLMGHLDVVPVDPETEADWTYPPFDGRIAEGHVWGRGAIDDKGSVLALLEAVELLSGDGFEPRRTLHLAFGHDEEVGGERGAARVAEHLRSRGVELEYVLDEGQMILDGILDGLSRPVAMIGVAEKGYASLELTVEGTGGHSSMPPAETAVGILSTAIHRLEENQFPPRLVGPAREGLAVLAPEMPFGSRIFLSNLWLFGGLVKSQLAASPESNASIRTTTAATMFEGSIKDNVLPTRARAVVNFRILAGDSIAGVVEHAHRTIADPRVQVAAQESGLSEPSPISPTDAPSYALLQRTVRQVFPEVLVAPAQVMAATDSRHFAELSANVYRFLPVVMERDDLARFHGIDERISVEGYGRLVRFYVQLIHNSVD